MLESGLDPELLRGGKTRTKDPSTVLAKVGDLGPEGLVFIPAHSSPNGKPLLLVGHEVSGSTSVLQLNLTY